jgi:hypothetical protein
MPIVALKIAHFKEPASLERYNTDIQSCAMASEEWHLEANYHFGSIGDVSLYRNTNANKRDADKNPLPANWQWYGAIPTANIKSYSLVEPPAPQALPVVVVEPQTANPKKEATSAVAVEKRA